MDTIKRIIFSFIFFANLQTISGQSYHVTAHVGSMFYQGDLAPKPLDLSFGPGNLSWGISSGINVVDWASINARFMIGRLTGDDAFADDPSRRLRNLSFASPLYEYGVFTNLKINKIWKGLDKYKVNLYLTTGINYIHFDPHALYQGKWVRLQPLGTEGQTIPNSGKKPYSLYTWARHMGLIVEFNLTQRLSFGMEFSPRKTNSDYIDDVSGTYVNYEEFIAAGNYLGAALANRSGEYLNSLPVSLSTGLPRGKADKKDWYTHFGINFKYTFGRIPKSLEFHLPDDSLSKDELDTF